MTDLDELIEITKCLCEHILSEDEQKIFDSLYEKLKKAEEKSKIYDEVCKNDFFHSTMMEIVINERNKLKQNQKTPEDIEKINQLNQIREYQKRIHVSLQIEHSIKLEKEIQQLKEERGLIKSSYLDLDKRFTKLQQDSKTNAEIVEKIRGMMEQLNSYRFHDEVKSYSFSDIGNSEFFVLLQSILNESVKI